VSVIDIAAMFAALSHGLREGVVTPQTPIKVLVSEEFLERPITRVEFTEDAAGAPFVILRTPETT
jgi:hypothetical protein